MSRKTQYYRFGCLFASKYEAKGTNLEIGVHLLLNTYQAKDSNRFGGPIASKYHAEDMEMDPPIEVSDKDLFSILSF
jgi:hypothetical protein